MLPTSRPRRRSPRAWPPCRGSSCAPGSRSRAHTTLRIGGPAEWLVEVGSERGAGGARRLGRSEHGEPFHLLGLGSNVLMPDEGLPGVVARLGGELRRVRLRGRRVSPAPAAPLAQVARKAATAGLAGLEALSGFPSTVGGAVFMNAGCYGTEIRTCCTRRAVVDARRPAPPADGDRSSSRPTARPSLEPLARAIVTRALFELAPGDAEGAPRPHRRAQLEALGGAPVGGRQRRLDLQEPARRLRRPADRGGGPEGRDPRRRPDQPASHANVIVNTGGATAADVVDLMRHARAEVAGRFGVVLQPEIILAGALAERFAGAA